MLRALQAGLLTVSIGCGFVVLKDWLVPMVEARDSVAAFQRSHALALSEEPADNWSERRQEEFSRETGLAPIAVFTVDRLGIAAPVYRGTSSEVLNAGIGWIDGTAGVDSDGNVGLSAHRDGYFRNLKDVKPGDQLTLLTMEATRHYTVEATEIVSPIDTSVLGPTDDSWLTLVTCYPFYFVGNAPKRFIVYARKNVDQENI